MLFFLKLDGPCRSRGHLIHIEEFGVEHRGKDVQIAIIILARNDDAGLGVQFLEDALDFGKLLLALFFNELECLANDDNVRELDLIKP